ncbi:MAG: HAMP domain-containing histidine kinase [Clostridia bacterium]|nr:HAMP domain-containing histidine kinase [Clostridia bacterium]
MSIINLFLSNNYAKEEKASQLKNIADRVNTITQKYTQNYSEEAGYLYQLSIDQLADYAEGTIFIVNTDGKVFAKSYSEVSIPNEINISSYNDVLNGKSTYFTRTFNYIFGYNTFSVAAPFTYNGTVEGIIFVIVKNKLLYPETYTAAYLTLISIAVAIVFAIMISFFFSKKLQKPLEKIGYAARDITKGKYTVLELNTKIDEYNTMIDSFNKMSAELKKQDKARSDFIANVSHDMRTPLTTIVGFTKGIMDGTIPEKMQNQYLGVVLSEAERMTDMVNNNLDLSKYESGRIKLTMSDFNLNDIVRSIVISMEKRIREKNITVQFKYETPENIVEADESSIYRVIQNLLDNALKFAAINTEIEISIINKNNLVYFSIKNYGSTISEEEQKYIWDRYYKSDTSRSSYKRGSGLGLFIVKSIIDQHNQDVFISSDENSVTFGFTLNSKKS